MIRISLSAVTDWTALESRWRELESRASGSFFQGWTWTGCLAEERFTDPVLLEAFAGEQIVAMALFNRRRTRLGRETLWLGESGSSVPDSVFVEWNGVLMATGAPLGMLSECLRAARFAPLNGRRPRLGRHVRLSGVDETTLTAAREAGGRLIVHRSLSAPYVDLASLRQAGTTHLEALSANTRYQIRRSDKAYEAHGELSLRRARTVPEALGFLQALAALHQATWIARGRPGAFAVEWFTRFHQTLIERGLERNEIALLRVAAGDRIVGFLYNFVSRGTVLAYQSGFDYRAAARHEKPGLSCHHQAIDDSAAAGCDRYDFLAGDDRYKRSLSTSEAMLFWAELGARWSLRRTVRQLLSRINCSEPLRLAAKRLGRSRIWPARIVLSAPRVLGECASPSTSPVSNAGGALSLGWETHRASASLMTRSALPRQV